jgi:hypothetical protein
MTDHNNLVEQATKTIADLPLWFVICLAMAAGLSGEMLRASSLVDLTWRQLVVRIAMRFGAAGLVGLGTFMAAIAFDVHVYLAAAMCIFTAVLGGDVASSLIERYAAKQVGITGGSDDQASG